MIYLDAGATTLQKPPMVAYHMQSALRRMATPGRGAYAPAMRAADAVYDCRVLAAELFGAQPEQVVFTMNATHALNLAIKTLVRPGGRAVISGFEHNAVVRPLHHIGAEMIVAGRRLFDPADTLAAFEAAVTPDTQAVVCTHVSNVFGYILPLEEIAALCRARRVPLIVDASQSAGLLPVSLEKLGAAFVCMPGHKALYGPQGPGLLLCGRTPDTLLEGGSGSASRLPDMPQELPDRAEAGTQNVCGICGLAAGLRFVRQQGSERLLAHEAGLRAQLAAGLQGRRACLYGRGAERHALGPRGDDGLRDAGGPARGARRLHPRRPPLRPPGPRVRRYPHHRHPPPHPLRLQHDTRDRPDHPDPAEDPDNERLPLTREPLGLRPPMASPGGCAPSKAPLAGELSAAG